MIDTLGHSMSITLDARGQSNTPEGVRGLRLGAASPNSVWLPGVPTEIVCVAQLSPIAVQSVGLHSERWYINSDKQYL